MGSVGYGLERTLVNTWLIRSQGSDDERATFLGNKSQNVFFFSASYYSRRWDVLFLASASVCHEKLHSPGKKNSLHKER